LGRELTRKALDSFDYFHKVGGHGPLHDMDTNIRLQRQCFSAFLEGSIQNYAKRTILLMDKFVKNFIVLLIVLENMPKKLILSLGALSLLTY
jgi:hypothetical protein